MPSAVVAAGYRGHLAGADNDAAVERGQRELGDVDGLAPLPLSA